MDERNFSDLGKECVEEVFRRDGGVRRPILLLEKDGLLNVFNVELPDEVMSEKLYGLILFSVESIIRDRKPSELFVGYEGFWVREETAIRLLVGVYYSDERERIWVAVIHGSAIGDWREAPEDMPLSGFEGLWTRARSYLRN